MGKGRGHAGDRAAGGGGDDDALLPWQQSHVDQSLPQGIYSAITTWYGYHAVWVPNCNISESDRFCGEIILSYSDQSVTNRLVLPSIAGSLKFDVVIARASQPAADAHMPRPRRPALPRGCAQARATWTALD